jgi:Family of unknown function (DUF6879)
MAELLDDMQFRAFFHTFDHTAWRLEVRDVYKDPGEVELLERYRAGERSDSPFTVEWFKPWADLVRGWTDTRKRMERVRVVTEPHSEYISWEMDLAHLNVEAGEDIRYLPRPRAEGLGLPYEDFWLFDSKFAVVLHLDDEGVRLGVEMIDDPIEVLRRCQWRDAAWHHAIPFREYASQHVQD